MEDFHCLDTANAGQIDVHQNYFRQMDSRKCDAENTVGGRQQTQFRTTRDELLDQRQIGRVVFDIEQGVQR